MKQKDILLIIVVGFVSAIIGYVLSKVLINPPKNRVTKVEVVEKITADFPLPDKKYFNEKSIDPTQQIRIGENQNQQPFKVKQ